MKKYRNLIIAIIITITVLISICFIPISVSKLIPTIEAQISKDLGVDVHIEKLILRLGPGLKLKTPLMHVMYKDGRKFAQFNNLKFYVKYFSIFKETPVIKNITAEKAIFKFASNDEDLVNLNEKIANKEFLDIPNSHIKNYSISYTNKKTNDNYILEGQNLELHKVNRYKTFKLKTQGTFSVNNKKYIAYDLSVLPQMEIPSFNQNIDVESIIEQIIELDFHSDIIADLKIYKTANDTVQASGFVNVDNVSVLDPTQKNSKSFIYLTLWGDKASILSNIYTSQEKKVYLEGMINNSKKPILDIKVKTDEIQIKDLYKKIKVLTDLSKIKNLKSVDGVLNANFTLKGDLNKLKSNGYLKISNASVKMDGLDINKINSEVDFNNNSINIVNAVGYANNSPIMIKGNIDKHINIDLLMNKVNMKYLCPEAFGVKKGTMSLVANFTGTLQNIIHKENLQIEDLVLSKNNFDISLDSLKIDTNKQNAAYLSNLKCSNEYTEDINIPSLKLLFEDKNIKIPNVDILLPNSKLTANANVVGYDKEFNFNSLIKGYINSNDIKFMHDGSQVNYPILFNVSGNKYLQTILAQLLLEKPMIWDEPTLINLSSKLDKKAFKIDDLSLLSFTGKFDDDVKQNLKGVKKFVANGLIEDFNKPMFKNVRLFLPQQMNIHLNDTVAQIKGDVFVNGELTSPEIIGQFSINNLFNPQLQLTINNAVIDFNKNSALLNIPNIKLSDSLFSLTGQALLPVIDKFVFKNINIKSKYLNTETLLMYKDLPALKAYPVEINEGKLYAERVSANMYSSPLYLTALTSNLAIEKDIIKLMGLQAEIYNGKIAGNIEYNLKDEHFTSNLMGRSVSASPIFDVISNRKDQISGIMDFDVALNGELTSKTSLNGDVKFVVNNGRMSSLGKLEHLLYAQNVIADSMLRTSLSVVTKAITLKDTGLFKYLRGDVKLENGLANINMLQSQGPLMALFIKGQYNPQNDYAKLTVLGRLSDEVMTGLGAFGDFSFNKLMVMLTGEDNKYNILPEDFDKIPQLPMKNTKEFRSIINGPIDKANSVLLFNWISYSQKSLKQKEVPLEKVNIPNFINDLPY